MHSLGFTLCTPEWASGRLELTRVRLEVVRLELAAFPLGPGRDSCVRSEEGTPPCIQRMGLGYPQDGEFAKSFRLLGLERWFRS